MAVSAEVSVLRWQVLLTGPFGTALASAPEKMCWGGRVKTVLGAERILLGENALRGRVGVEINGAEPTRGAGRGICGMLSSNGDLSELQLLEEAWLPQVQDGQYGRAGDACGRRPEESPGPTSLLLPTLACPGGASIPCSGHGVCMDGMSGSGQCQCHSRFTGTACELCASGAFGPQCQGGLSCPTLPSEPWGPPH